MGKEGTHSGHRKRVRMEFFENGFSPNTPTHKIVEMMLYYAVRERIQTIPRMRWLSASELYRAYLTPLRMS